MRFTVEELYNIPVTYMEYFLENDYMITISDEFMRQMLATTRKYCVVIFEGWTKEK
jgi:hypothetical protein